MDLEFDIHDEYTLVRSSLSVRTRDAPLGVLALNARDLEIRKVECREHAIRYYYDRDAALLKIYFDPKVPPGTFLRLYTESLCRPSDHLLEGLYYDAAPPGAPPQQITQCQQWGFQRLVPCIDYMTAKCTYTTTITADARYTNIISNGDVAVPRHPAGAGRDTITYENVLTPMAPYLFFLGVGTYATYKRRFEYPDGSDFMLELLVPPDSNPDHAGAALEILADAILWIHLFTGSGQYQDRPLRHEIYLLAQHRDRLLHTGVHEDEIRHIRARLSDLIGRIEPGYAYTGTVYREIGMQNSDFGGMENVGNTTISTNRIMPFDEMTDPAYEYLMRVKVHEFYHNLNGSEVTGRTPFEIWLNEAVTVHVEEQYHAFHFGDAYSRLQTVMQLLAPGSGTFSHDRGTVSMPIEPDGFNDPNELITGVTYVKAPEFVRMIETLMGREAFAGALARYHTAYRHGNASRAEWIATMEEVSGMDFAAMAEQWLKQRGYPDIQVSTYYDEESRRLRLHLHQDNPDGENVWEFPFVVALVDKNGRDIDVRMRRVRNRDEEIIFEDVPAPAFISLNRNYSAYGRVFHKTATEELLLQALIDPDLVNRYLAYCSLMDREKEQLISNPAGAVSETITDLWFRLISDDWLMGQAGGRFLGIFESLDNDKFAHDYQALHAVKQRILRAIGERHHSSLLNRYHSLAARIGEEPDVSTRIEYIKRRQVKNATLEALAATDTPEIHALIREQYSLATNASDRLFAFALYLDSTAPDRGRILDEYEGIAAAHPVAWEAFLGVVASASSDDVVSLVRRVERSEAFHIEQANDQRALYVRFAQNRKKSLQTAEGRKFLRSMLPRLAEVNEYSTVNALSAFGNLEEMDSRYHVQLVEILVELMRFLDPRKTPSVYNTTRRLLLGAPSAVQRYRRERGDPVPELD